MWKWLIALPAIFIVPVSNPDTIFAHAFGTLYNLPVPFWLYLYGAVAAVVASFLIIAFFFKNPNQSIGYSSKDLSKIGALKLLTSNLFFGTLKIFAILLFLVTIISGFIGIDNPRLNINMTFFWIIFVLCFTYGVAIFGNVWVIVNPWRTIIGVAEAMLGRKMEGIFVYPKALSFYPALVFYFLFIWIELFGETGPKSLSVILVLYSAVTISGVLLFGKSAWFKYAEFFSVFFRLIGKIAPFELKGSKLYLRLPVVGLFEEKVEHFSLVLFILFMLSSTAFDGFRSTVQWTVFAKEVLVQVVNLVFGDNAILPSEVAGIFGLPLALFVFLYIYLVVIALSRVIAKSKLHFGELTRYFAYSLVPIAVVYNIAHYYTLIQTEGQNMIRLISDPFGLGWNLFGTSAYRTNYAVVDANFAWHSQVAVILFGHVVGVYLAHVVAIRVFPSRKRVLVSQLPMLILMIVYTVIGLWILSQPITIEI